MGLGNHGYAIDCCSGSTNCEVNGYCWSLHVCCSDKRKVHTVLPYEHNPALVAMSEIKIKE
eukprot:4304916-Amphidinium_carterae.1